MALTDELDNAASKLLATDHPTSDLLHRASLEITRLMGEQARLTNLVLEHRDRMSDMYREAILS